MPRMKSTQDIKVPEKIIDQVLGQDEAVNMVRKAAHQRRHVLLIGDPGTGKSLLGLGLAELLPKEELKDILAFPNPNDENNPLIKEIPAGKGREEVKKFTIDTTQIVKNNNVLLLLVAVLTFIVPWWVRSYYKSDLMFTAFFLGGMLFLAAFSIMLSVGPRMFLRSLPPAPKLIVDNYGKKQAPFYDATGSHAGALLGDILHDPLQCYFGVVKINSVGGGEFKVNTIIDQLFAKHKYKVIRKKERSYEAIHLLKNELFVWGETNGSVSPVEVLSSNRHEHNGEMIKLTTSENKELIVTPEHKIAVWKNGKTVYTKAGDIKEGDEVIAKTDIIMDEEDIINTYDERQQKQCKLYYQYKKLKAQNPTWGYKRIARALGQDYGKTRWWHTGKYIPVPIQTINWLKKRKILPLKADNPKLPLIAKVLGAIFGDGGIFENLNAIFLSSSELKATQEFGMDMLDLFGFSVDNNMRTIRGGVHQTSFCYQNTNRKIIRFFQALGAPVGKKTTKNLLIPAWIKLNKEWEHQFYGSLFGSELGVSLDTKCGARIEFGITGEPTLESNRINFLNQIINYLNEQDIIIGKIHNYNIKKYEGKRRIFRFVLSQRLENTEKFSKKIKINYCNYKKENLRKYLDTFEEKIYKKYYLHINKGYGAERIMEKLKLNPNELYTILNQRGIKP